uniref:Proline rich 29 n=1 Tax=Ailuropoda melanoleuca TaxID=9646 RepID=A0A7N5K206_AILME
MASGTGGSWGQPPPQSASLMEKRNCAPTPTPQCHRHCGCG